MLCSPASSGLDLDGFEACKSPCGLFLWKMSLRFHPSHISPPLSAMIRKFISPLLLQPVLWAHQCPYGGHANIKTVGNRTSSLSLHCLISFYRGSSVGWVVESGSKIVTGKSQGKKLLKSQRMSRRKTATDLGNQGTEGEKIWNLLTVTMIHET